MPFIPNNSPEARLPRSDSKNPATTCKGITSNGRPCRRALAASTRASPSPSGSPSPKVRGRGVLAVLPDVNENHDSAAAFYCWQHKDQAVELNLKNDRTSIVPLTERSSLDTLADRLGVLSVEDGGGKKKKRGSNQGSNIQKQDLPPNWQHVSGPLMSVAEDSTCSQPAGTLTATPQKRRTKGDIHFSFFCCMKTSDVDDTPPSKPRPRPAMASSAHAYQRNPSNTFTQLSSHSTHVSRKPRPNRQHSPNGSHRPSTSRAPSSQTQALLALIPASLAPATTSLLLAELAKPLTAADQESGYIYIFCLSLTGNIAPGPITKANNLYPDLSTLQPAASSSYQVPQRTLTGRRTSDAIRSFAQDADRGGQLSGRLQREQRRNDAGQPKRKLMLKIGRATNVSRRMTQWAQQCGHPIDLLRYYPYQPAFSSSSLSNSSHRAVFGSSPASPAGPRKAPLVARVERLIHLELADQRVKRACEGCKREHREWFEVDASREGIKAVDEVVRRWVSWGENENKGDPCQ